MARVVVPVEAFRAGLFPPMCAKTGARADTPVEVEARVPPGMIEEAALALHGLQAFAGNTVRGRLPYAPHVVARRRAARLAAKVAFGAMVVAFVAGLTWVPAFGLFLGCLAAALFAGAVARRSAVRAEVVAEGRSVRLDGVCTAFAEAVRGQGLAVDR